jgi:ferredoxin
MPGLATAPRHHVPRFRLKGFRFPEAVGSVSPAGDERVTVSDDGSANAEDDSVPVTVRTGEYETTLRVKRGARLRDALLDAGFDVYGSLSRVANCGGRGLCGTCGVRFEDADGTPADEPPAPEHWHDRAAAAAGYPRLSCRITVERPLTVRVPEKVMWGQLLPDGPAQE